MRVSQQREGEEKDGKEIHGGVGVCRGGLFELEVELILEIYEVRIEFG